MPIMLAHIWPSAVRHGVWRQCYLCTGLLDVWQHLLAQHTTCCLDPRTAPDDHVACGKTHLAPPLTSWPCPSPCQCWVGHLSPRRWLLLQLPCCLAACCGVWRLHELPCCCLPSCPLQGRHLGHCHHRHRLDGHDQHRHPPVPQQLAGVHAVPGQVGDSSAHLAECMVKLVGGPCCSVGAACLQACHANPGSSTLVSQQEAAIFYGELSTCKVCNTELGHEWCSLLQWCMLLQDKWLLVQVVQHPDMMALANASPAMC